MIVKNKLQLKKIIDSAKKSGKSVLIKKGVFDIIHPGHIFAISLFKKYADVVIILTQSDSFTTKKKGKTRPINKQTHRNAVLDGIKGVDYVFSDKSNSRQEYLNFLLYLKPTVLAVTSVDPIKTEFYSSPYWKLKEFPDKNKPGYSTTDIINNILKKYDA
jgi:cytidyltransferase-like protein